MAAIYPISDLQKHPSEVKAKAHEQIVHLTENGKGAYVFATEEYFEEYVERRAAELAFEERCDRAIEQGMEALKQGNVHSLEEARAIYGDQEALRA
ncbi:MAG: hypothetical protein WAY93_03045 [Atopobiaceae bacterium]|jgi:PHD/YefM family antitoxin component YafN of YafNO toxin-antitoxin module